MNSNQPRPTKTSGNESLSISGTVERVTFHSEESGFCVLKVVVPAVREEITVVGTIAQVSPGEYVEAEGFWRIDSNYGKQFQATRLVCSTPTSLEGIERYLGSKMVKGVGPHFAKLLVERFGSEIFNVIESDPKVLGEIRGIGEKRIAKITASWHAQVRIREIMVFLHSHGVGTARAVRIYKTYGDEAIEVVRANPYRLASEIRGIGFKTADLLAKSLGIASDSALRARAGVSYVLSELSNKGHCGAEIKTILELGEKLLEIDQLILRDAIDLEIGEGSLIPWEVDGVELIYLSPLYYAELGVATNIARLMRAPSPWREIVAERAIAWIEKKNSISLSLSQREAIELGVKSKVLVITGGPGVGKTTLLNSLIAIISARHQRVLLTAPTGRAAKRMSEATGELAKTIHRTLDFDPATLGFRFNQDNRLECDYLVIDEVSMIDVVLMNKLLSALPEHAGVVFVGDVDQLPSLGPGAVLSDIIESHVVPTVRLTEVFRQAGESMIVRNAHRINSGLLPILDDPGPKNDFYFIEAQDPAAIVERVVRVVTSRIPSRFHLDPISQVQVLTPMNRGGTGARALNESLAAVLSSNSNRITKFGNSFSVGDKVLQVVNNYDKDVFNGDIGIIQEIDLDEEVLSIDFENRRVAYDFGDLDEIVLAYATSIHKSQGSEYPCVVIPLSMSHYSMLDRNILYTALTRAKSLAVIVGDKRALAIAVSNRSSSKRLSGLRQQLTRAI